MKKEQEGGGNIYIKQSAGTLSVFFSGEVKQYDFSEALSAFSALDFTGIKLVRFSAEELKSWDSSLLAVVFEMIEIAKKNGKKTDISDMPENVRNLITLAFSVDRKPTGKNSEKYGLLEAVGEKTIAVFHKQEEVFSYLKKTFDAFVRFFAFRSVTRISDFFAALNDCGPKALGIVVLISFLVGLILAFVGAVQLQSFGAQIYVASLVTIGMCRIMGAIMVGIIIAGRTGSSYAATIGTMQVNEELDALETMGLSKIDFLVTPRLLALIISMPILTMLADFAGMMGGAFVGVFMLDLPYQEYWRYAIDAFTLKNFLVGVFHGFCFGIIIALCGCYSGLTCGRNADSVGVATTNSVVNSIVLMIVATGIITVIFLELGI